MIRSATITFGKGRQTWGTCPPNQSHTTQLNGILFLQTDVGHTTENIPAEAVLSNRLGKGCPDRDFALIDGHPVICVADPPVASRGILSMTR